MASPPTNGGLPPLDLSPDALDFDENNNNDDARRRRRNSTNGAPVAETPHTAAHAVAPTPTGRNAVAAAEAEASAANSNPDDYSKHPVLLTFNNAQIEKEYIHYVYSEGGGIGGKLYVVLAVLLLAAVGILYQKDGAWPNLSRATESTAWIVMWAIGVILAGLLAGAMFIEPLHAYREYILMAIIGTHWPAFQWANLTVRSPERYGYTFSVACYFFCSFISQPRVSRMAVFLSVTPLATYAVVGGTTDYFDNHTPMEIFLWPLMFFPLGLLWSFEKVSRKNFEQRRRCNRHVEKLQDQTSVTQSLVANFFAPTPTYLMLASRDRSLPGASTAEALACNRGERGRSFEFTSNVGFIATDIAGFTQWSSQQQPRAVIAMVRSLFGAIDNVLDTFGVEKVMTIGDAFIGASFPPIIPSAATQPAAATTATGFGVPQTARDGKYLDEHPTSSMQRLGSMLRFALAIVDFAPEGLRMRVGAHVGGVICGCFGSSPPGMDLLGADYKHAQVMEQTGAPGQVHASHALLAALEGYGMPIGPMATDNGKVFNGWECESAAPSPQGNVAMMTPSNGEGDCGTRFRTLADFGRAGRGVAFSEVLLVAPIAQLKQSISERAVQVCELLAEIADDGATHNRSDNRSSNGGHDADDADMQNLGLADDDSSDDPEARGLTAVATSAEGNHSRHNFDEPTEDGDDDAPKPYDFSVVRLEFYNKREERKFLRGARKSSLTMSACTTFAYMALALYIAHALLGCTGSTQNRLVLAAMGIVIGLHFVYLSRVGIAHRYNIIIIYLQYAVLTSLAVLGIRADCTTHPQQELPTGNVIMLFYLVWSAAPQFLLEIPLKYRTLVCFATGGLLCGLVAIRRAVIRDDAMQWDFLFGLEPVALIFVSYFADFSQRRAFQSRMRLRTLLASEQGRHAEFASRAMDVTLPRFVSERIVAKVKAAGNDGGSDSASLNSSEAASSAAGGRSMAASSASIGDSDASPPASPTTTAADAAKKSSDDAKAGLLKAGAELVWDFPHVAVMFISFGGVADPVAELHSLVRCVEEATSEVGVFKIKTIGTTVLCAAGMQNSSKKSSSKRQRLDARGVAVAGSPEEAVWGCVQSALSVLSRIGPAGAASTKCGVHIGNLVGAVVGAEGLMFDVFGDTVNTASRICSSCPLGSVRLSEAAARRLQLLRDLDFTVADTPSQVQVKGKGTLHVFDVNRLDPRDASMAPPDFTTRGGGMVMPTFSSTTASPTLVASGTHHLQGGGGGSLSARGGPGSARVSFGTAATAAAAHGTSGGAAGEEEMVSVGSEAQHQPHRNH